MATHDEPEKYSVLKQPVDDVHTRDAPLWPFDVVLPAQAHTESVDAVAAVFVYALPKLHTVTADEHCATVDADASVVEDDWKKPEPQVVHTASALVVAAVA